MKHELICVSVVSPILNPSLWPRPGRRERLHVFINRQREKRGKREMSPTDDWNHMELVESNSSCDNTARSPPHPPTLKSHSVSCHSRSGKTAIGEGQSVAGAKNKVIVIFKKYMRGSEEEMVLPPNTQLHVITIIQPWRMVYSILL